MIVGSIKKRDISAKITGEKKNEIKNFIQGSVYCWCKNCQENDEPRWFKASDLFGGDNYYWNGTPLIELFNWHDKNNAKDPVNMAGRDVGELLRDVILEDDRKFKTRSGYRREYLWIK